MVKVQLELILTDEQAAAIERSLKKQNEYMKSVNERAWDFAHYVEVLAYGAVGEIARKEIEEE